MLEIKIDTGNAAYRDDVSGELDFSNTEIIKNLQDVIRKLEDGITSGTIIDTNGNKTGTWKLEDK